MKSVLSPRELILFVVALAVRAVYAGSHATSVYFNRPVLDALWIHQWAQSLASGEPQGAEAYFRAPLYPHLVAGVYAVVGALPWVVAMLQHLLGACMVIVLYRLGRRIGGEAIGLLAGALQAFYWIGIFFEGELLIVTVASALGLGFLAVLASAGDRPPGRRRTVELLGAGFLLGMASIARPTFLVLVPLALAWPFALAMVDGGRDRSGAGIPRGGGPGGSPGRLERPTSRRPSLLRRRRGRGRGTPGRFVRTRAAAAAVPVAIGLAVPILPVLLRNVLIARDPVLISAQGGLNLYVGNGPGADGKTAGAPGEIGPQSREAYTTGFRDNVTLAGRAVAESALGRELRESEVSAYWLRRTWEHVRSDPGSVARGLGRKLLYLLNGFEIADNRDLDRAQREGIWVKVAITRLCWVLPFAWLGVLVGLKSFVKSHLIVSYLFLYGGVIVLFFVNARFRLPLAPGIFILAAIGLRASWHLLRGSLVAGVPGRRVPVQRLAACAVLGLGALATNARPFEIDEHRARGVFRLNHAFLLLESGDCAGAIAAYAQLGRDEPDRVEAAYQGARARQRCGDPIGALAAFSDVTSRWPTLAFAHLEKSRLLATLGDSAAAAAALTAGVAALDSAASVRSARRLAHAGGSGGEEEGGVAGRGGEGRGGGGADDGGGKEEGSDGGPDLRRVRADAVVLNVALGDLELRRGRFVEAETAYRRVIDADPRRLSAWMNYGYTLVRLGRAADALLAFERVLDLEPGPREAEMARRNIAHARGLLDDR